MSKKHARYSNDGSPPKGESWAWFTLGHLASPAWGAMTLNARRVIDCLYAELVRHGGRTNGDLTVSYDQFVKSGIPSRQGVASGIRVAKALGFLVTTVRGQRSYGGAHLASSYALTWRGRRDGSPATNEWKAIKTRSEAKAIAAEAHAYREPVESTWMVAAAATSRRAA